MVEEVVILAKQPPGPWQDLTITLIRPISRRTSLPRGPTPGQMRLGYRIRNFLVELQTRFPELALCAVL